MKHKIERRFELVIALCLTVVVSAHFKSLFIGLIFGVIHFQLIGINNKIETIQDKEIGM